MEEKPISKGYTLCDYIYITFLNTLVVVSGQRLGSGTGHGRGREMGVAMKG